MRICSFEGCGRKYEARGYCGSHYRHLRNGWPVTKLITDMSASERFWRKVDKSETCWNWQGSVDGGGYGIFWPDNAKIAKSHRFSYQEIVGPIPKGLHVDHLCKNRKCVRPEHLQTVTQQENNENTLTRSDNTSGFKGVSYHKATGKWMAYGQYKGKNNYLGVYKTPEEAAQTAKKFRLENHTNNLEDYK